MTALFCDSHPSLVKYYRAEDHGHEWHVFCNVCGKGWALDKDSKRVGNVLHLLNHALSHKVNR